MATPAMNCTQLVGMAYATAFQQHTETHKRWIAASFKVGGQLPHSLLMVSIQRVGQLDILLRSMEDEFDHLKATRTEMDMIAFNAMSLMSELWVGSIYEVFRLCVERQIKVDDKEFNNIAHLLRLIRIPLEKHEIAQDSSLKETLELHRNRPGSTADIYVYDKKSKEKSHIMPTAISGKGSMMWKVIDLKAKSEFWIERRFLADKALDILTSDGVGLNSDE